MLLLMPAPAGERKPGQPVPASSPPSDPIAPEASPPLRTASPAARPVHPAGTLPGSTSLAHKVDQETAHQNAAPMGGRILPHRSKTNPAADSRNRRRVFSAPRTLSANAPPARRSPPPREPPPSPRRP